MRYHNITTDDMRNGDGLRVVLWVSGCNHHCKGCHNPITWDENDGLLFDDGAKDEVFRELSKDYIAGITFSGGDPLHPANRQEIGLLMQEIRQRFPQKTIWLYTGDNFEDFCDEAFTAYIDVCVDGVFLLEQKDTKLRWKGSKNQRVIDVKKSLALGKVILYVED